MHQAHNDSYRWGGVNLTLEEGPKAIWTKKTIERLEAGEWDEWIERVIIGTTEDEGTIFTLGNSVCFTSYCSRPHFLLTFRPSPPTVQHGY